MKKHTKIYYKALNYPMHEDTFVPSEVSGNRAVDIHHIVNRDDRIENLMALTRTEHDENGEIKSRMVYLLETHRRFLIERNVPFENEWFDKHINFYNE